VEASPTSTFNITLVTYAFEGFFAPIDNTNNTNPTIWNSANASQGIPAKWRLTQDGNPVSDPNAITIYTYDIACSSGTVVEAPIEEYAAGNSGLTYQGNGNWQFTWKTPKNYAKTCKRFFVQAPDGTKIWADFKFK